MIRFLNEINEANKTGNGVQLVGKSFIKIPKIPCEDGPIPVVHQVASNLYISPVPIKHTCNRLYCQDSTAECKATQKATVCHQGVLYTTPVKLSPKPVSLCIGIIQICYETHLQCKCLSDM